MQVLQDFHKKLALFLALILCAGACGTDKPAPKVTAQGLAKAEALLEDAGLTEAGLNPERTSLLGLDTDFMPAVKSYLSGASQAAFERERLLRLDLQSRLAKAPLLPNDHPLARDLLITRLSLQDVVLLQKSGTGHLNPGDIRPYSIDPFAGLWIEGPQTLVRDHVIETHADADAYIQRMAALADGLHDTRRRLLADAATGHLPSASLLKATRQDIEALLETNALEAVLTNLDNFSRALPTHPDRPLDDRLKAARGIYEANILPAYRDLAQTLVRLEGEAPIPIGLWTQPGGVTLYNDLLNVNADPLANAETLWISLDMAAQNIRPHMVEPDKDAQPGRPDIAVPAADPLANAPVTSEAMVRQRPALSTRSFTGITTLPARYDNRRPMIIEWEPERLAALPAPLRSAYLSTVRREAETLYQSARIRAATRSPIRAFADDTAFAAGWVSYYQMSIAGQPADSPVVDLETVLAAADLGIHTRRWSLQEAADYIQRLTGLSAELAKEAALRIAAKPADAVGTHVHTERFQSLEARARQILANRFDLNAFQAVLLKDGPRPLPLVERDVEDWYQDLLQ